MTRFVRAAGLVGALSLALVAGCTETTAPTLHDVGFLTILTQSDGSGGYNAALDGVFLRAVNVQVPDSKSRLDGCTFVSNPPDATDGAVPSSLAGDSILVELVEGGSPVDTTVLRASQTLHYVAPAPVPFNPGVTRFAVTIPGDDAGFPAASATTLTVPPLATITDIPASPAEGDDIPVAWSPAGDDSTHIQLTMKFATIDGGEQNTEISCSFLDDGASVIPSTVLGRWSSAFNRTIAMTRFRTHTVAVGQAGLQMLTRFDTTLTASTAP